MRLNKDQFIDQFVVNFLSAWCANEYTDACMRGEQERLDTPPVEDARYLAEQAWSHYNAILGEQQ